MTTSAWLPPEYMASLRRCADDAARAAARWEDWAARYPDDDAQVLRWARKWRRYEREHLATIAEMELRADMHEAAALGCPCGRESVALAGFLTLLCQGCGATWKTAAELRASQAARAGAEPGAAR